MIERRSYDVSKGRISLTTTNFAVEIHERERVLRDNGKDVISIFYHERRIKDGLENKGEIFYVNGTAATVSYNGDCIPITVTGTPENINKALPVLEELIDDKLIENNRRVFVGGEKVK